ncbi:MAG: hypothetical protein ACQETB_11895 [Halobacteriota archaeon]
MSERTVLPAETIPTYLACPRRYEYEHDLEIPPDESTIAETRALGAARSAIGHGLEHAGTVDERIDAAVDRFRSARDARRPNGSSGREYVRTMRRAAVRSYLRSYAETHGRTVIETNGRFRYGLSGVELDCPVDALVELEGRPVAIRFQWTLDAVAFANSTTTVDTHTSGRRYRPWAVGSVVVAAATIEAIDATDRFDRTPGFAVVGLTHGAKPVGERTDANWPERIEVSPAVRRLDAHCRSEGDDALGLLDNVLTWLTGRGFDPSAQFEEIHRTVCESCPYSGMCSDFLNAEVRFP